MVATRRLCWFLVVLAACSAGPRPETVSPEAARCEAVSDSVSKYVSADALPFAHLIGIPRLLPVPANLPPGDSVAVILVVRPEGRADTSSVQIIGASDAQFRQTIQQFAAVSRFTPAQLAGCNIFSRYDIVVKGRAIPR